MILTVAIKEKIIKQNILFKELNFDVKEGEIVGLVGRNGVGKTTLVNMIAGLDHDYEGDIIIKPLASLAVARQEHHGFDQLTVLDYILGDLPEYSSLFKIINSYPSFMADSLKKQQVYSDALERFSDLNYFAIEDDLKQYLITYQLNESLLYRQLDSLSGGQKRLVELIKIQRSKPDLAILDEPTNHMDYIAKESFINWLKALKQSVIVISHDRDVLTVVDKIVEIKDGRCQVYKGNYSHYLQINYHKTSSSIDQYEQVERQITNKKDDVKRFKRLKEKSRTPGTIRRFKSLEIRAQKDLDALLMISKPSIWIDQNSLSNLKPDKLKSYQKLKTKNINLSKTNLDDQQNSIFINVTKLSLGYNDVSLFKDISFEIHKTDRLRLHGRNGVGKSTIINFINDNILGLTSSCQVLDGEIKTANIKVGFYHQEIKKDYLAKTIYKLLEELLNKASLPNNDQQIYKLMSDYLFEPMIDNNILLAELSGGQKARIQIIEMLINQPELLILDEPTNHLDLPSIEELEDALINYSGAILFVSHDNFFVDKIANKTITIQ